MSTEAQRAPVPPRPTAPPRPAAPPDAHGNPGRTTGAAPPPPAQPPRPAAPARQGTAPADQAPAAPAFGAPTPAPERTAPAVPAQDAPTREPHASAASPTSPATHPSEPEPVETTTRLRVLPAAAAAPAPTAPPRPITTPPPPTRRRPVGAVDLTPRPGATPPRPGGYFPPVQTHSHALPYPRPETPAETTTRLRPVRTRRPARTAAAAACVVLGLGLIGGAVTGSWLISDSSADAGARDPYATGRTVWHNVPVDTLFPRTLKGDGAGPGGADRVWTRIAVAPDSGCTTALDPLLLKTIRPVGCERLLRATYVDATSSSVTTVGMIFTQGSTDAMRALSTRFSDQHLDARTDLMPRTYAVKDTVAAGFGDRQRASWTVHVLTEVPVVVFAVSGFADGRTVGEPQPVAKALAADATTAAAQAGLGHEAKGIADRIERGLRRTVTDLSEQPR